MGQRIGSLPASQAPEVQLSEVRCADAADVHTVSVVPTTGVRERLKEGASNRPAPMVSVGVELKLARARAAFGALSPDDPRARLLQVAVLRRDEVLLDALLRRLDSVLPR